MLRFLYASFFLSFMLQFSYSQKETYVINTRYIVLFENGKKTGNKVAEIQKTYNTKGQIYREIIYDTSSTGIDGFIYHYYTNEGDKISEERYNSNDEIAQLVYYRYKSPIEYSISYYTVTANNPVLDSSCTIVTPGSKTIEKTYSDAKNKWVRKEVEKYQTDSRKRIAEKTVEFHKKRGGNKYSRIYTRFMYNNDSIVDTELTQCFCKEELCSSLNTSFTYSKPGNLLKNKLVSDDKGNKIRVETYRWRDMQPYSQDFLDKDGIVYKAYRFEIYTKEFNNIGELPSKANELLNND